jgi:hypothetical protein
MTPERRVENAVRPRRPGGGSGSTGRRRAVHASGLAGLEQLRPAAVAAEALGDYCRQVDAAIHVERRISRFLPFFAGKSDGFDMDGVVAMGHELVDDLEHAGDAGALAALRGLAAVADDWLAPRCADAAARLAGASVAVPSWADQIGRAEPAGAYALPDPEDDGFIGIVIDFEYPDGERHGVASYIAPELGGIVKHLFLLKQIDEIPGAGEIFDPMPIAQARGLMRDALVLTDPGGVPDGGGVGELGPLAWSRVRD